MASCGAAPACRATGRIYASGATTQPYRGRLELTWTNKELRLLAHEDGSYEWVPPADYRVAEVRRLDDVASEGKVGDRRAADNLLIHGDALNALTSLAELPEFAEEYLGKVKLVCLDSPFIVPSVRRRARALGLADDDARPAPSGEEASAVGWVRVEVVP